MKDILGKVDNVDTQDIDLCPESFFNYNWLAIANFSLTTLSSLFHIASVFKPIEFIPYSTKKPGNSG